MLLLGSGPPLDLVGFSFEGLVGTLWALSVPHRIRHLVLVGAPGFSNEAFPPLDLRPWHDAAPGLARRPIHRHNLLQLMLAHECAADDQAVTLHAANVERDLMRRRRLMLTDVVRRALPALSCEVCGIWGSEDLMLRHRPGQLERDLPLAPRFRRLHVVPKAGHWVQYEAADAFNRQLAMLIAPGPHAGA